MRKPAMPQRNVLPGDAADRLSKATLGAGLTIRALEVFAVVAKTGTMVAAAKQLKLTQPAILSNRSAFSSLTVRCDRPFSPCRARH
jgi:hypothetical protein